jgi:CubicO group peptidase (beta-lactamase class C family)
LRNGSRDRAAGGRPHRVATLVVVNALRPLIEPPFGTAAVATMVRGSTHDTVAIGVLRPDGPRATKDSLFNVASVSKVLTAARIVSLARVEAITLDDPVAKHLPGVRMVDDGGIDRAGTITVRHLVEHRSGLPHLPLDLEHQVADRWSSPNLLRLVTDRWTFDLVAPVGRFAYSNLGYALLGAIIERVGNCSFADCMAEYLRELGMTRSTFWPEALGDDAAHGRVVANGAVEFNDPAWYASRFAIPYSGLWTSMTELAQFGRALVAASRDPAVNPPLGIFRGTRLGAPSLEHDGSGPGFHAALVVVPSKDIVLAIATNGGSETKEEGTAFGAVVQSCIEAL